MVFSVVRRSNIEFLRPGKPVWQHAPLLDLREVQKVRYRYRQYTLEILCPMRDGKLTPA